jgi:hypothetical protein
MRQRPWLVLVGGFGGLRLLMAAAETGVLLFLNSWRHSGTELRATSWRAIARSKRSEPTSIFRVPSRVIPYKS